jgi:tetratricopeptide (TPR) repeat protein
MNEQIEKKLSQANTLREEEKYSESAKLYTDCLIELIPSGDPGQLIHCLAGQSLIYKILTRKDSNHIYQNLTIAFGKEAYEVGEANKDHLDGITLSTAYMAYADALLMDEKISESLPFFEKALLISTAHPSEKGRIKAHIGGVKYILGDKVYGINLIKEALADIRTGDLTTYPVRVWETGALNGLAKIMAKEGHFEEAKQFATESLQIATDHNLSIRKREVEEIISMLTSEKTNFSL